MKFMLDFGHGAFAVPDEILNIDDPAAVRLLLLLCKEKNLCEKPDLNEIASKLFVSIDEVIDASEKLFGLKLLREDYSVQTLSGLEISKRIDEDIFLKETLEECAKFCDKLMLDNKEISGIIDLIDNLKMEKEAIILLFSNLAEIKKKQGERLFANYAIKSANIIKLRSVTDITDYFEKKKTSNENIYKFKKMFGLGKQQLSKKQSECLKRWTEEWNMSFELITSAYNIAADERVKRPVEYTDIILENWHNKGVKTVDEIPEKTPPVDDIPPKKKRREQQKDNGLYHSFDADEFFNLALKRSEELMEKQEQK